MKQQFLVTIYADEEHEHLDLKEVLEDILNDGTHMSYEVIEYDSPANEDDEDDED